MQQRKLNRMIEIKNWCQLGRTKLSVEEAGCSLILNEAISLRNVEARPDRASSLEANKTIQSPIKSSNIQIMNTN
jgi:hypothetical protein